MKSSEIRQRYLKFFEKRGHKIIPSASLVPENDPSSLFTTAGMQPLVPYLLGTKHPAGTRLVDVQKCVRTGDIEDVGDNRHLTFFEMLGNWSLGDYFKKEAIEWSLEFLTNKEEGLGLDPKRLYVTVFRGEDGIPRDEESITVWQENFSKFDISAEIAKADEEITNGVRIIPLGKEDNFWIAGQTGPCGGDTEMFYDVIDEEKGGKLEGKFQDLVKSGRIIEIWNNVFMEYNKKLKPDKINEANEYLFQGKEIPESFYEYIKLEHPNVDTGMGLERTAVVMQEKDNVFETDIFEPIIKALEKDIRGSYERSDFESKEKFRIIADHIRSAVFIIAEGIVPGKNGKGYVLRRLLRRVFMFGDMFFNTSLFSETISSIITEYKNQYKELEKNKKFIEETIRKEEQEFQKTMIKGSRKFELSYKKGTERKLSGLVIFKLVTEDGFPIELIRELAKGEDIELDEDGFLKLMEEHRKISKVGSEQKFKGGLAGTGEMETKYHTATHLLLASLRSVLKGDIVQKGSNITSERMRFDFNWPEKVPSGILKAVEDLVNQKIAEKIPVEILELPKEEAKKIVTILSFDLSKYGDGVKVYKIGDFSVEFCGGPHVKNTGELGHFKIVKEEASSAGVRRIKAILEG